MFFWIFSEKGVRMIDKIVDYAKNNLPIVAVVLGSALLMLVVIIVMIAKKSKVNKTANPVSTTTSTPTSTPTPAPTPVTNTEKEEREETAENGVKAEEKPAPAPTPAQQPVQKPVQKPAQTSVQKTAQKTTQKNVETKKQPTKEGKTEEGKAEEVKTVKKTAKDSTRYTGKWVICRVVTAAHAEGNLSDEFADETFFFELRASNGEKLLTSEEYTSHAGAVSGIATHKANIEKGNFRITLSKKGDYIFKLLNGKNMLLCMGEHYSTKARCESAIESAKRFAKTAVIDENVQDIVIPTPTDEEEPTVKEPENGYVGKWIIRSHEQEDERVFYFELYASNGEKLLSSEEYTTYTGAVNGIETHKTNIEKGRFKVSFTKRGDYIYKLLNGNNQLLCLGEHYKTRGRCESAIESVKRFAKTAPVYADPETASKRS